MSATSLPVPQEASLLERQRRALMRLLDLTGRLARSVHLPQILQEITQLAQEALECERATLYQYDPKRQELFSRATTRLEVREIRRQLSQGICGYVARTRQTVHVPDVRQDPRWSDEVDRQTGFRTRNVLAAPILSSQGELLGVLQVLNKRTGGFEPFDEQLLVAFCQHAATALERAQMIEQLRRQEAVRASLEVARSIQRSFMPSRVPQPSGYELTHWWFPHQQVGGDYLDIVPLGPGELLLVMADVSGHGLGPALLMASARAALHALVVEHQDPAELLTLLNRSLAPDLQQGRFITMALVRVDVKRHRFLWANAGHGPALHYRAAEDRFTRLQATGVPLGVMEQAAYESSSQQSLNPGDILLLCTDGIVEAQDSQGTPFGLQELEDLVRRRASQGLQGLVGTIAQKMRHYFVNDQPQDDLTVLALRRRS